MAKHISPGLERDKVCPIVAAAYNFLPTEHARESPFFLMFGRDPRIPLTEALRPRLRYLGNDDVILSLEAFKNMYLVVMENLRHARGTGQHQGPVNLYQLYIPRGHIAQGLCYFGRSGEHTPAFATSQTNSSKPCLRKYPRWCECTPHTFLCCIRDCPFTLVQGGGLERPSS